MSASSETFNSETQQYRQMGNYHPSTMEALITDEWLGWEGQSYPGKVISALIRVLTPEQQIAFAAELGWYPCDNQLENIEGKA